MAAAEAEAQVVVTAATAALIAHMPLVVLAVLLMLQVALVALVVTVTPLMVAVLGVAVVVCIPHLSTSTQVRVVAAYCPGQAVLVDTIPLQGLLVAQAVLVVTQVATVLVAVAAAGAHLVVIQVVRVAKP